MTTRSFEFLTETIGMVRHDAPEVFRALERSNPHAPAVRERFFTHAATRDGELVAEMRGEADGRPPARRWA